MEGGRYRGGGLLGATSPQSKGYAGLGWVVGR